MAGNLLAITGQTATGKTSLALKLAESFPIELISADARQIYAGLDIGTGKIGLGDTLSFEQDSWMLNSVPIHGINLINPDQTFSASEFATYAQDKITQIESRQHLPVLVGGTAYYLKSLFYPDPSRDIPPIPAKREEWSQMQASIPLADLVASLQAELSSHNKDRLAAMNNSDRHNPRRLMRAIEVAIYLKEHQLAAPVSSFLPTIISLQSSDEILYQRIAQRVDQMFKLGLEAEVADVQDQYGWQSPGLNSIGYFEWQPYFEGTCPLSQVRDQIIIHNRQYARKQKIYLKNLPDAQIFDIAKLDLAIQKAQDFLSQI